MEKKKTASEIFEIFTERMGDQLNANIDKGDWTTFDDIPSTARYLGGSIGKLFKSVDTEDKETVQRRITNVANALLFFSNAIENEESNGK